MMPDAIVQLFEEYLRKNHNSTDRALAETIQAIALLGLSRTDFFIHAAFYGGTALRLLYKLDRFSEDLDFSLLQPKETFRLTSYFEALRDEMEAFGFTVEIGEREKEVVTPIQSAFIKANTRIHVIQAGAPEAIAARIHKNAVCKVKLEVDIDPPPHAEYLVRYIDDPVPFSIRAYSGPSLLAGKMDAILYRGWRNRIKGRDWYDLAFLVRRNVPLLLPHLEARLRQRGVYSHSTPLDKDHCTNLIAARIDAVDFAAAKADVVAFVRRPQDLDVWSREYFHHVLDNLRFLPEVGERGTERDEG